MANGVQYFVHWQCSSTIIIILSLQLSGFCDVVGGGGEGRVGGGGGWITIGIDKSNGRIHARRAAKGTWARERWCWAKKEEEKGNKERKKNHLRVGDVLIDRCRVDKAKCGARKGTRRGAAAVKQTGRTSRCCCCCHSWMDSGRMCTPMESRYLKMYRLRVDSPVAIAQWLADDDVSSSRELFLLKKEKRKRKISTNKRLSCHRRRRCVLPEAWRQPVGVAATHAMFTQSI